MRFVPPRSNEKTTRVERKGNLGGTKQQRLWNELLLITQSVNNRKNNEKKIHDIAWCLVSGK